MATKTTTPKTTTDIKRVAIPSDDIRNKLKGFSVAKNAIKFRPNESELGEYAPEVSVKMLKNSDMMVLKDLFSQKSSGEDDEAREASAEIDTIIKSKVTQIKIFDVSENDWVTFTADKETGLIPDDDYDMLPQAMRVEIINYIFSLNGMNG